ncbi:hypothetical protein CONCODRAFT_6755 [Conidiobolus coronatus NRRL 28638]|uniref:Uncharacterized protein n=1 Tax=Conidiobolus coronatus (strain ATCC 28846 / CBS 209.66 / NRRL 28638) TaxID=796925 RepID=A0A137P6Q3_CONC2|nr:hypothetical protein CONCODRAFT_6755 [Conidiobolus coronatus NRRL 28638]|eukprot:KXN70675.1 hypothetical protein CONCODRAFT_6755 [Conidiobolus coronatus NRRL 28638]
MIIINWADIVCWRDLNCYLDQLEIYELSLLSKLWRKKLTPLVFRKLDFSGTPRGRILDITFANNYKYNGKAIEDANTTLKNKEAHSNTGEKSESDSEYETAEEYLSDNSESDGNKHGFDESRCECKGCHDRIHHYNCDKKITKTVNEIIDEAKQIQNYVTDLMIYEDLELFPYRYHFNIPFIKCFSYLSNLELLNTRFYLNQLNNIFSGLERLEYLILRDIVIIGDFQGELKTVRIELPKSVKNLYIEKGICDHREYEETDNVNYNDSLEDRFLYFVFNPQYLPNMKKLTYINEVNNFDSVMVEFLRLNPQLSYLSSTENAFTMSLLDQISLQSSLKHLEFIKKYNITPPLLKHGPRCLSSLEYLEISIDSMYIAEFYIKIIQKCSNLSHLYFKNQDFNIKSSEILDPIFSQLDKLQTLSISGFISTNQFSWIIKNESDIKRLNLINTNVDSVDLDLIIKQANVKHIYIKFDSPFSFKYIKTRYGLDKKYDNWKTIIFTNSINFYKTDD